MAADTYNKQTITEITSTPLCRSLASQLLLFNTTRTEKNAGESLKHVMQE